MTTPSVPHAHPPAALQTSPVEHAPQLTFSPQLFTTGFPQPPPHVVDVELGAQQVPVGWHTSEALPQQALPQTTPDVHVQALAEHE